MADQGHLVIQELQTAATEQAEPMPATTHATSVANPRRIRLTRLAQGSPGSN